MVKCALAVERWGDDMERLLVQNNCCVMLDSFIPKNHVPRIGENILKRDMERRTFGSETGIGEILRLRPGFADLELGFLEELVSFSASTQVVWDLTWKSFCFSFFRLVLEPMIAVLNGCRLGISHLPCFFF